jgi:hemerythrin
MLPRLKARGRRPVDRIEWDESLETGDAVLDLQHRTIHTIFNQLRETEDDPAEVLGVLDFLTQHVIAHFVTEEDLMPREEFPPHLAAVHIAEHRTLTDSVRRHVIEFRAGELTSTVPLLELLHAWLVTHVHDCDRLLVEHIRNRGVSAELADVWTGLSDPRST